MSKAEEKALKAYPKETRDCIGFVVDIGHPQWIRNYYIEGYEQAEKDTIKKAVEWLAKNAKYYANNSVEGRTVDMDEDFLTDFRKAMEEE